MKKFILISAILLSACATKPMQWVHPELNGDKLNKDLNECEYDAAKANAAVLNPFMQGMQSQQMFGQCMKARGYIRQPV